MAESGRPGQGTQHFGHAPRLGDAAARRVRRLGVEDLADRPEARLAQMGLEAAERLPRAGRSSGYTFSQASTNGPISQPQTVPWW